jgi:two-component system, OmpR family, phosphate regulon sensor histidine kinase PhoR
MWPVLALIVLAALGATSFWWARRCRRLRTALAGRDREFNVLQERHRQLIAHEQAQLAALFNSMVEGVLLLDGNGRIRLVNQALERLFNASHDLRGLTIMEAFRMHALQELVGRAAADGRVLGFELELPGLQPRSVQVNAITLSGHDTDLTGAILVFHDLTRLKHLERTRQEFVANVSHELRTPLSMIKGFIETLLDGAKDDPLVATRFLETVRKHSDRLTFLIEDLLTISRLESGQVTFDLQLVDLPAAVERVFEDLRARAGARRIRLENRVPVGLHARADAERLQQVLVNLVDNALKYGRAEGTVTVGAQPAPNRRVELFVRDDGPGVPAEAQARIFERFYRVDKARSREQGGTGLGLAIVKHLVQAQGGEVRVESELGHGATFLFTLPIA